MASRSGSPFSLARTLPNETSSSVSLGCGRATKRRTRGDRTDKHHHRSRELPHRRSQDHRSVGKLRVYSRWLDGNALQQFEQSFMTIRIDFGSAFFLVTGDVEEVVRSGFVRSKIVPEMC